MSNILNKIVLLSLGFVFIACGGSAGTPVKQQKEVINGYALPPEPDPKVNNAILLGVDSNNNGVRDDIERWIVKKYKNKAERAVALQISKAMQKDVLVTDEASALEAEREVDRALDCQSYYWRKHTKDMETYREGALYRKKHKIIRQEFKDMHFNTPERIQGYINSNKFLSGKVLGGGGSIFRSTKDKCDQDIDSLE